MAIKGKRKKKSRQAARRPAAAPRSLVAPARKPPWYRTTQGQVIAGGLSVALVVAGLFVFKNQRDDQRALESRQESIEEFTGEVQALLQKISPSAGEMLAAKPGAKDLGKDANRWAEVFKGAQKDLKPTVAAAPPEVDVANRMILQSVLQYAAAAETFKLVPQAVKNKQLHDNLAERAQAQVAAADGTWEAAIAALDQERTEADLDASGLRVPSAATAPTGVGATP